MEGEDVSRSQDYFNGVPCEVAERIMRKRKPKALKVFRRRDPPTSKKPKNPSNNTLTESWRNTDSAT